MNLDEFTDKFLQFEYEKGMFEKRIDNVYYWKYVRFLIMNDLYKYLGLFSASLNGRYRVEYKYNILERMNIYTKKNTKLWKKRDVLIIPHSRKYEWEDGTARCIYTDAIDKNLKRSHYILDGKSVEGYYKRQRSKSVIYEDMDVQFTSGQVRGARCTKIRFEQDVLIPIEQYFQIKISLEHKNTWIGAINSFLDRRPKCENYYKHALDIICPKVVIITVGYSFNRMILCEVAQERKIPVIEIQHGGITKDDIPYNYYCAYKNLAFPDYIFCYGELEKEQVRFPINKENVIPVGFPELERMSKGKEKKNHKTRIMFVSQLNPIIAQYAKAADKVLEPDKYEIVFKLHPKEYDDWRQRYGDIFQYTNIRIVGDFRETIYDYLNKVDFVVGVYSTVLWEATLFDVKIVILKESLYEVMKDLYEDGYAVLVDSPDELIDIVRNNKYMLVKKENNKFFKKNSVENMIQEIERIIKNAANERK